MYPYTCTYIHANTLTETKRQQAFLSLDVPLSPSYFFLSDVLLFCFVFLTGTMITPCISLAMNDGRAIYRQRDAWWVFQDLVTNPI